MNAFSNTTNPLEWIQATGPPSVKNPEKINKVVSTETIVSNLFAQRNLSNEDQNSLQTWKLLRHLIDQAQALPNGVEAIKEAGSAWNSLMAAVEEERSSYTNESTNRKGKEKQCPHFLNKVNATVLESSDSKLRLPCG